MEKVYISGAITRLPGEEVTAKFGAAEKHLVAQGYEAVSPLKNGIPYSTAWEAHIAMDIILLMGCEAIYLLPDWSLSKGATLEKAIAELTGKKILYQETSTFEALKKAVAEATGVSFYDVAGSSRERKNVYARMVYAYFCLEQGASITDIAREMKRSHSTVIYYLRKFEDDRKFNQTFRQMVEKVESAISTSN
jgi:hypothetical protein